MKRIFLIIFLTLFLFPLPAQAICSVTIVPCGGSDDPCTFCHFFELFNNILELILTCLVPIVAGLMFVLGGLYILVSGVSPETFAKGKTIVTAAVIGLVIIFTSYVVLNSFLEKLEMAEWTGLEDWWEIKCEVAYCGDGILGGIEECDDGNNTGGDGCSAS